jgi:hypothetical protein
MGAVYNRAAPHVRRLAMIHAAMNGGEAVNTDHLSAAIALWHYCAESARYIFGASTGNRLADDILEHLRGAGDRGMTRTELSNCFGRHQSASRLNEALTMLESAGLIRRGLRTDTGGRPAETWFAKEGRPT